MTPRRPSSRELVREIDDLRDTVEPGGGEEFLVAHRDPRTGELTDTDGEPVDPDDHGADWLVVINDTVVMEREHAEAEGREILGPFEDAPDSRDVVRVAWRGPDS